MAPTRSFRADELRSIPTGLVVPSSEEDGQAAEIGADDRHAGPENNGIDPHNVAGTTFEVSEEADGGMLEVSAPVETIDEVNPASKDEKKFAKARAKEGANALEGVAEGEKNEAAPEAEDETHIDSDSRENVEEPAEQPELPPVEHETGNEKDVTIETDTAALQEQSNAPETGEEGEQGEQGEGEDGAEDEAEDEEDEESTEESDDADDAEALPEGRPNNTWRVGQIDRWAAEQVPPVTFHEGATRKQKLAQIKDSESN